MATLSSSLILTLRDGVTAPARAAGRALDRLTRDAGQLNRTQAASVGALGGSIRNLALMGAGYLGVTSAIGGTVGQAMSFETSMANVEKISGMTGQQLANMATTLTDLSNRMPMTRNELAELVSLGSQFGVAADQLDEFALVAGRASEAFQMSPAETAESLSVMMNAFGVGVADLERLTDQINFTADRVGGSESTLMDFLARTGPTAQAYGISAETLLAYGGGLQAMGISAERASTGMNAVMVKMSSLTENEDAVQLLDRFAGEGVSERLQRQFYERPTEAMNELFRISSRMTAEQKSGFFGAMFGLEYGDDAAAIVSAMDKIMEAQRDLADETQYLGGVQRAYDTFAATTANRLRVLGNNLANIGGALGSRLLGPIADFSDRLVAALGTLDESVSVFDRVGAGIRGFFDGVGEGLGLEEGDFGRIIDQGWTAIFGDPAKFEEDVDTLTRIFLTMQDWGRWLGEAAKGVGEFFASLGPAVTAVEQFLSVEPGTAADLLGSLAENGLKLVGVGLALTGAARGLRALAGALFVLSGARALVGGAQGVSGLFGALAGANALAGGGPSAPPSGRPRGIFGRIGAGLATVGTAVATDPAWDLTRSMFLGEGHEIDPAIAGPLGDATRARLESQARGEALRAQTLTTVATQTRTFDQVTSSLAAMRGGVQEAERETTELETQLTTVGSMTVAPQMDFEELREGTALAARLESYLSRIGAASGPVAAPQVDRLSGARASGGPVTPGTWLVGEEGPELVSLRNNGHVFDARETRAMMEGRGGSAAPSSRGGSVTINLGGIHVQGAPNMDPRDLARLVMQEAGQAIGMELRSHFSDAI